MRYQDFPVPGGFRVSVIDYEHLRGVARGATAPLAVAAEAPLLVQRLDVVEHRVVTQGAH